MVPAGRFRPPSLGRARSAQGNRYALRMPFGIGIWELLILLLVLLLVFGPKRLPEMGRQLGKGMREFKESVSGKDDDDRVDDARGAEVGHRGVPCVDRQSRIGCAPEPSPRTMGR